MGDQQKWIEVIRKSPAWLSGGISLATAVIGFVLLLQGNVQLGVAVLGVLLTALLLFGLAYVAFARTTPLIEGGRGVYRFEKYRPWALLGLGIVAGLVVSLLLFRDGRRFVVTAFTGQEDVVETETVAGQGAEPVAGEGAQIGGVGVVPSDTCFETFFGVVEGSRVETLENGATAQVVLDSNQTKREIAGLHFTDFGRSVGAMTYYDGGEVFASFRQFSP